MPSLPNLDLHKSGDGVSILLSNHIRMKSEGSRNTKDWSNDALHQK